MNIKKATNSQLSTTESKKKPKQTTITGTEPQIWRSFGGLSAERGKWERGEEVQGLRSTNWQVQNRQGDVKNSIGNGGAKELICMIHGHDVREEIAGGKEGTRWREAKGEKLGQL